MKHDKHKKPYLHLFCGVSAGGVISTLSCLCKCVLRLRVRVASTLLESYNIQVEWVLELSLLCGCESESCV
ncbi:unnamed protein product [Amoebophrya sp. A25]|nr:unnamed protein product [Amoebophrya sp. A25]|eukprot:GSA25T00009357001.1